LFLVGFAILPIRAVLYTLSDNSFWLIGVQLARLISTKTKWSGFSIGRTRL
jgi:hypothetical protein